MNQLSLVIVALVAFTYFGGSYVPSVLKSNKQMLLGVVGGLVLGSFFGVEGGLFDGHPDWDLLFSSVDTGNIGGCSGQASCS